MAAMLCEAVRQAVKAATEEAVWAAEEAATEEEKWRAHWAADLNAALAHREDERRRETQRRENGHRARR
jgi:hypothetical protein